MNSKKAKALRRMIRQAQAQMPERFNPDQMLENTKNRKVVTYEDLQEDGSTVTKDVQISMGTIKADPSSAKGLYNHLKKVMTSSPVSLPSKPKTQTEVAPDGTAYEATPWKDDGSSWTPEEEAANIETIPA